MKEAAWRPPPNRRRASSPQPRRGLRPVIPHRNIDLFSTSFSTPPHTEDPTAA